MATRQLSAGHQAGKARLAALSLGQLQQLAHATSRIIK